MIDVKLEDFEKYRKALTKQASNLLRNRGFGFKKDLVESLSEDIVQNTYIEFQRTFSNSFVSEKHFENFLRSVLYTRYQMTIDTNRKGGQYLLFKTGEFDQMDVNVFDKSYTEDEFDTILNFKKNLTDKEIETLDYLIEGYSQLEIADKTNLHRNTVNLSVTSIKKKYKKYENTNS